MNRVIIKESNNFDNSDNIKQEDMTINKMPRNKYRLYAMTYQPHTYEEILKIYDESTSDDEIVLKIDALIDNNKDDDDYLMLMLLKDNIENYIRCKEMEKKLKQIENFKEQIIKDNAEIYFINKKLKNNEKEKDKEEKEKEKEKKEKEKEKKEKQKKEIAEMKSEINKLKNKVNILEQKVNFMEPVVISIICRKMINYCMIKVLEKYKNKIKVTVRYNDYGNEAYKITFIDNVNTINIEESNKLLDILFDKKE